MSETVDAINPAYVLGAFNDRIGEGIARHWQNSAMREGGYLYATNGFCLVRIPDDDTIPAIDLHGSIRDALSKAEALQGRRTWVPAGGYDLVDGVAPCLICAGTGRVMECAECAGAGEYEDEKPCAKCHQWGLERYRSGGVGAARCPACLGTGATSDALVQRAGQWFGVRYLRLIVGIFPNAQIGPHPLPPGAVGLAPAMWRADGADGLLMPCHPPAERKREGGRT